MEIKLFVRISGNACRKTAPWLLKSPNRAHSQAAALCHLSISFSAIGESGAWRAAFEADTGFGEECCALGENSFEASGVKYRESRALAQRVCAGGTNGDAASHRAIWRLRHEHCFIVGRARHAITMMVMLARHPGASRRIHWPHRCRQWRQHRAGKYHYQRNGRSTFHRRSTKQCTPANCGLSTGVVLCGPQLLLAQVLSFSPLYRLGLTECLTR